MKNTIIIIAILALAFWGCEEPDTTPLQISISSPINGATVSDTITIKALVADDEGVKSVEFYLDGDLLAFDVDEPFEVEWNTKESTNGTHTLQCKAIDESDNETLSENISITVYNIYFSASFTEDYFCPECGEGILFLSDFEGNVLFDETVYGNETVDIEPIEGQNYTDRISVSTVYREGWNTDRVTITTDMYVEPSSWELKGLYFSIIGEVTLNFTNFPDHTGYMVTPFGQWGSQSDNGSLSSSRTIPISRSPDNIYIRLNTTSNGPMYKWVDNVQTGDYTSVDLSDMQLSPTTDLYLPTISTGTGYYVQLQGYVNPNNFYDGTYILDRARDYEDYPDYVTMSYPNSDFSQYRTRINLYEDINDVHSGWQNYIFGDIPTQVDLIDADGTIDNVGSSSIEFETSGTFDQTYSLWKYDDGNGTQFRWRIYGPPDFTQHQLPELPQAFKEMFPGINKELFEFVELLLVDHENLTSWDEIIDLLFKSESRFRDIVKQSKHRFLGNPNTTLFGLDIDEDMAENHR